VAKEVVMNTVKAHRFPVSIQWWEGRLTQASAPGKPPLEVATPPEFKGGLTGVWSPEDLLVTATATSYAVTLLAVAEAKRLTLLDLQVDGIGHVERRKDGRYGFVAIELVANVEVEPADVEAAEKAARHAKEACLVALALDAPVHLELHVEAREPALVT
jgi:organic hydroperoxide reductase OsmC/OhrA